MRKREREVAGLWSFTFLPSLLLKYSSETDLVFLFSVSVLLKRSWLWLGMAPDWMLPSEQGLTFFYFF